MILRPYQERMVERSITALRERGNTLAVAPTGAGKTIVLSAVAGRLGGRQCILQHRDELIRQNSQKFNLVNPKIATGFYTAREKCWRMPATFASVQTLARHTDDMPALDALIIDEAHHAVAQSYQRIVDRAISLNPHCRIYGVTATPARGDKKGLGAIFDNCCDLISISSLMRQGFLVSLKPYSLTLGSEVDMKLAALRKTSNGEYDMEEADEAMNTLAANETIFREWQKLAASRKTIIFCSTVRHSLALRDVFLSHGVKAAHIDGSTPDEDRRNLLAGFESRKPEAIQVLCNVAVLTEGYDSQPVSCVCLARPCSQRTTMIQMIGRGLRKVDQNLHPGLIKKDCLALDFGNSFTTHGADLDIAPQLEDAPAGDQPMKECPQCGAQIPLSCLVCPICGHAFQRKTGADGAPALVDGQLSELDFFQGSPFNWCDLFGSGRVMVASGFNGFCVVVSADGENWLALGQEKESRALKTLAMGEKLSCLSSADDFFRLREDSDAVRKNKRWMKDCCTDRQWELLRHAGYQEVERLNFTKYQANSALNFFWNRAGIEGAMRRELHARI